MKKILLALLATLVWGAANVGDVAAQTKRGFKSEGSDVVLQMQKQNLRYFEAEAAPDEIDSDASSERVEVMLDRSDLTYYDGETGKITVKSSVGGYLYLVNFDVDGKAALLFPNQWSQNNKIAADAVMTYPAKDQKFVLRIRGPKFGKEQVRAYVTNKEIKALDGVAFGKNVTEIDSVLADLGKEIQESVKADFNGAKFVAEPLEDEPEKRENSVTIGHCVYYTKGGERPGKPAPVSKAPRRIFVGIGINQYKDKSIRNLKCCVADARTMGKVACDYLGVEESNCLILVDGEATLAAIRKIFTDLLPEYTQVGDEIFVYWSGHGDKAASGVTRFNDAFLVPSDANVNDRMTMLGEHTFGNWLQNDLKGRKIILFLDACHSSGMLLGGGKNLRDSDDEGSKGGLVDIWKNGAKGLTRQSDSEFVFDFGDSLTSASSKSLGHVGMFAMASSGEDELSWESAELSVATYHLVNTLKKGDSSLTHKDLVGIIRPLVEKQVAKERYNAKQTVKAYDGIEKPVKLIRK